MNKIKSIRSYIKKSSALMLACLMVFSFPALAAAQEPVFPDVVSDYIVVMDADSGEVLFSRNPDERVYPASTTKLLTALLTVENCDLTDTVTFSEAAVGSIKAGYANASIAVGEELTVEQSLYCLILRSANEVAYGLAEHIAGSVSSFSILMNDKLAQLGAVNSHFTNASGLHDSTHYTTTYDMALIAQAVFNNKALMKIVGYSGIYTIPETNKRNFIRYYRHRYQMLEGGTYEYKYSCGGKTGYTEEAGNTLVSFAQKDDLRLICVVMKGDEEARYTDTAALFDYYFNNYTKLYVGGYDTGLGSSIDALDIVGTITGSSNITLKTATNAYILAPNGTDYASLDKIITYADSPAYVGKSGGFAVVSYYSGSKKVGDVTIYAQPTPANSVIDKGEIKYINIKYILAGAGAILVITGIIILIVKPRRKKPTYGSRNIRF